MLIIVKYGFYTIEPIFPNTEKYTNSNKDVEIPTVVKNEIFRTALRAVRLAPIFSVLFIDYCHFLLLVPLLLYIHLYVD